MRQIVNGSSGNITYTVIYDSFGKVVPNSESGTGDRFKFTGREWDSEIGQYHYRARYYDPGPGRFGGGLSRRGPRP